jgi:hypothetical protein
VLVAKPDYCGFRFNAFASSDIDTDSALTNVWNSSAPIVIGSTPWLASFSHTAGSASAMPISRLSLATMSRGVPAGAKMPIQKFRSELG